jgi:pimeloyl-ACP methyl ester carboxylesterase
MAIRGGVGGADMWVAMVLFACTGVSEPAPADPNPAKAPVEAPSSAEPQVHREKPVVSEKRTETLTTRDGVALEADLYFGAPGANGVVLLHMIPPHWDRTSWPTEFLEALAEEGLNVCVPDRRGAGASKGVAEEAYTGEKGRYDVEACVKRLQDHGIGKLGVIGASNGTTSMLDYAVWAEGEGLPVPAFLGFMTGGSYTEKQTGVVLVEQIPAVFTYSSEEREWSHALHGVSSKWVFHEYPGGDHGTEMFKKRPDVLHDLMRGLLKGFL